MPDVVRLATQEYRDESDPLADFIVAVCVQNERATIAASDLFAAYKRWAGGQGMTDREVLNSTAFGRRLRDRYRKGRRGGTVHYYGIGLPGQLQDSFEANVAENNGIPIFSSSRERDKKTIPNYPAEARNGETILAGGGPDGKPVAGSEDRVEV